MAERDNNPLNDALLPLGSASLDGESATARDEAREKVAAFVNYVQSQSGIAPSRNWRGFQLVLKLHRGEELSEDDRDAVLLVSCENETDTLGEKFGIDQISVSPQSLQLQTGLIAGEVEDGETATLPDESAARDGDFQFQLDPEQIDVFREKKVIYFVGASSEAIERISKMTAFIDLGLIKFMIEQKYLYMAIGVVSRDQEKIFFEDMLTDESCKDMGIEFGQDMWGPE